ncbi:MAG TPA: hypothetical protein VGM78_05045, partial [Ilumatobacteraceae bacterium]
AAVVLGLIAYFMSHGTDDTLQQNDASVLATFAVVLALVGCTAFMKVVVERVLRFWMARITFEQAAQTERLLAQGEQLLHALNQQAGIPAGGTGNS